jgi:hypothetical protein
MKMQPELTELYKIDPLYAEYVERHGLMASDPETRHQYELWQINLATTRDALFKIKAEGKAEGKAETMMEIALIEFRDAKSEANFPGVEAHLKKLNFPEDIIKNALQQVKAERAK